MEFVRKANSENERLCQNLSNIEAVKKCRRLFQGRNYSPDDYSTLDKWTENVNAAVHFILLMKESKRRLAPNYVSQPSSIMDKLNSHHFQKYILLSINF